MALMVLFMPAQVFGAFVAGFLLSILIETPILLVGLSARHSLKQRLFAGVWLTACTYPVVFFVLPAWFVSESRALYLLLAETFAPAAECALFWAAFGSRQHWHRRSMWRDFTAIILANLASFGFGELFHPFDSLFFFD